MLEPGARIGRYEVQSPLGRGGMGYVYRAVDTALKRPVALKVLRESDLSPAEIEEARARFLREARSAAAVKHPNVITIYDVGVHDGTPYLVMELVAGSPLRGLIHSGAPLTEKVRWLCDVARGLAAAHAAGLVHRDVKPDNVIVGDDGVVKVLDFGLAKPVVLRPDATFETLDDVALGTPRYMAPEQIMAGRADARADQFAWGRMAFELLTGVLPPRDRDLPRIAETLPSLPKRFTDLLDKTQALTPGGRAPDMQHVVAVCESVASELRDDAGAAPPTRRVQTSSASSRTTVKQGPKTWLFVGGAAPFVVVGLALVAYFATRAKPPEPVLASVPSTASVTPPVPSAPDAEPEPIDAASEAGDVLAVADAAPRGAVARPCYCRERYQGKFRGAMCTRPQRPECWCRGSAAEGEQVLCPVAVNGRGECPVEKTQAFPGAQQAGACSGFVLIDGAVAARSGEWSCSYCADPEPTFGVRPQTSCRGIARGTVSAREGAWDCNMTP